MTTYLNPSTRNGGTEQIVVADQPTAVEVEEAPYDDTEYVRINGEWQQVTEAGMVPDTLAPSPPTGLSTTGTIVTGGGAVDYELTWVAPTTNVDATPLVDLAYYVVRWRYGTTGAWASFVSNDTSAIIHGLTPAVDFEWEVLARDTSGNDSTWTGDTVEGLADTVGPEKPSLPILTSRLGTISVRWDGLDHAGGPPPPDFDHLEFYMAATSGGPWTYLGRASGADLMLVTAFEVGDTRFFTFVAVDTSGNVSPRSAEASIVVQGILSPDIDTSVFDSIDADIAASLTAAELDAQEKADLAEAAAINSSKDYVQSRGTNLITNGTGLLGDNTNFSSLAFSKADAPTGISGAFLTTLGSTAIPITDEFFPVDPLKKCRLSFYMKQLGTTVGGYAYAFLYPHDAFKLAIDPGHVMYVANTLTTLAAPLNPGDTTVTLTSSANWYGAAGKPAGANVHLRRIIFWDYVDAGGKAWPQETYSRNVTATNFWADGGIVGNVITLNAPYAGPAKPAGTKLSNGSSGGTFMYGAIVNAIVPKAWTRYAESIVGIMAGGVGASFANGWPPGTAFAKAGFLVNRQLAGAADAASQHAVAGISFGDAEAAAYDANNITEVQITTDAITAPKIKAGAVIAGKLAADAVLANNIKAGEVVAGKLAADSVATLNLQAGAITATKIGAGEVTAGKLATNSVQAGNIEAGAITTNKLAVGAVDAVAIATDAVTATKIQAGAVTATKVAAGAITADKLSADAIDGKTITGALIRTAASGSRWEIGSAFGPAYLIAPSSDPQEVMQSYITVNYDAPSDTHTMELSSGTNNAGFGTEITMTRKDTTSDITLNADTITMAGDFSADLSGGLRQLITVLAAGWAVRAGFEFVVMRIGTSACLISGQTTTAAAQSTGSIILAAGGLPTWARPSSERNISITAGISSPSLVPNVAVRTDGGLRMFNGTTGAGQAQAIFGIYPL